MAEDKKPIKKSQPISDVEKPGKTAASPTSKSIIIKTTPLIKDPMVVEETDKKAEDETSKNVVKAGGSSKIKLQPLTTSDTPETKDEVTTPEKPNLPDEEPKNDDPKSDEPVQSDKPAVEDETDSDKDQPTESKDKALNTPDEQDAAEASRKAEHDANLQKIVDSKTYYLPINAVEKRKTKRFVLLGIALSIFLILVWINVALDAGLIQIDGVSPLTSFFSS